MSKLTSRGTSKDSLYSVADAEGFMERAAGSHTLRWKASAHRWKGAGGFEDLLMENIPITGGTLTMDSSDPIRSKLTLEVGGGEAFAPATTADPLVPFGQFVRLALTIDRADGTWFPWLQVFEGAISSYVFERPSLIATVEAYDYSGVVNEFLHTKKTAYGNRMLSVAIDSMIKAALPNTAYSQAGYAPGTTTARVVNFVSDAGSSRWDEAVRLAEIKGRDVFFDWAGDPVLRANLGDYSEDIIPDVGPDVGTVDDPVMVISDGPGGTLVGMTATLTREGACNGVYINIHETADQKAKTAAAKKARGDSRVNVQVSKLADATSGVQYGDVFGRLPAVFEKNVSKITDTVVSDQTTRAKNILARRQGLVRYIDLDLAGGYWLEPDDVVKIKFAGREENHFVQSVTLDLAGQAATRIKTRQLLVGDPGA